MTKLSEAAQKKLNNDLIEAAWNGDTDTCLALIAQGADVNAKNNGDRTALMLAARRGHTKLGLNLIAQGADVHAQTIWGETALTLAVKNGRFDMLKTFHEHEVDISSVKDLILAHDTKMRAGIQEKFQKAALEYQKATLEYQKAMGNLSDTSFGPLAATLRKAQTQTNEPETVPLPAVANEAVFRGLNNT